MRILLLGDVNSAHIERWAIGLATNGFSVGLWSLTRPRTDWFRKFEIENFTPSKLRDGKLSYFFAHTDAKKALDSFHPDILHAHYASSYGMIGRKLNFHPYFISVWGSDITQFPKDFFRKFIIRKNLRSADKVFATSHFLSEILEKNWGVNNTIIPFGIDVDLFHAGKVRNYFSHNEIVFGTVKALEPVYGIDAMITAFELLIRRRPDIPARLLIAGDGSMKNFLVKKVEQKGIESLVKFTGKVPFKNVPDVHREIDVFLNLSSYESFGVSVLESSSCGKPVIVSDVDGLKEVVKDYSSGYLVSRTELNKISMLMENLAESELLRNQFGKFGREYVEANYNWKKNLEKMISTYTSILSK